MAGDGVAVVWKLDGVAELSVWSSELADDAMHSRCDFFDGGMTCGVTTGEGDQG